MGIALPSGYTLQVKRALLCLLGRNEKICCWTVVSLKWIFKYKLCALKNKYQNDWKQKKKRLRHFVCLFRVVLSESTDKNWRMSLYYGVLYCRWTVFTYVKYLKIKIFCCSFLCWLLIFFPFLIRTHSTPIVPLHTLLSSIPLLHHVQQLTCHRLCSLCTLGRLVTDNVFHVLLTWSFTLGFCWLRVSE